MRYVGAIDQGTTSSRFVVVNDVGEFVAMSQMEHEQILPRPGWVEHDPEEIWESQIAVARQALERAGIDIITDGEIGQIFDRLEDALKNS